MEITVRGDALAALQASARTSGAAVRPGELAGACAQAVDGLGSLASAAVLAELAVSLTRAVTAVQARWLELVTATGAAADRYAALEVAVVRSLGPDDPALLAAGGAQ